MRTIAHKAVEIVPIVLVGQIAAVAAHHARAADAMVVVKIEKRTNKALSL